MKGKIVVVLSTAVLVAALLAPAAQAATAPASFSYWKPIQKKGGNDCGYPKARGNDLNKSRGKTHDLNASPAWAPESTGKWGGKG